MVISMHMNQRDLHKGQKSLMGHKSAITISTEGCYRHFAAVVHDEGSTYSDFDAQEPDRTP